MLQRFLLLAFAATIASAQTQSILELARQAPPEIFADAVIKLVERGEIPADRQSALLQEAFQAAKRAREPVRLRALPITGTSTRAALRDAAGALGLDALSLESRVLKIMAETDRARALELFQSIDRPALQMRPCEDPMIAEASAYYETLAMLAPGQTPLLMLAVAQARAPSELASFAKMLAANKTLPNDDLRLIAGALALKLGSAAVDYRSFTMTADELRIGLTGLAATPQLAEAVRKFTTEQMSWPRCDEEFGNAKWFVEWFNKEFRGAVDQKKPDPIREEETRPTKFLGMFKTERYFESGEAKQISDDFGKLRPAAGKPEWREKLAEFLREVSAWKPQGADIDAFHQKMTVLHGLFQLIPPGEDRDTLITRSVEYLKSSGMEREYPAEWLLQVKSFASSAAGDRSKLLAAFQKSDDAGLAVFAALEGVPQR
jgi:hypothetical protein